MGGSSLVLRGIVWFGAYVSLVLAPAAVAALTDPIPKSRPLLLEFSVALGFLAFAVVLAQFALVSRLRAASRPFGTDALVQFHQYIGFVALALVLAHPLLLNARGMSWSAWNPLDGLTVTGTGALALWAILTIIITTVLRRPLRLPYEWWQGIHLLFSVVAASAMLWHVLMVGGYTAALPVQWVVLGYAAGFAAVTIHYRLVRPLRLLRRPWTVIANDDIGGRTRMVCVKPDGHDGFAFEPGQFAWLVTGRTTLWSQQHPLSICSSAEVGADHAIEFSVKALGDWSAQVVPRLEPGTRVWVEGPFGAFTIDRPVAQGFVMIAGGIGIAPMRSMLLTMRDRGDRRHVVLVYAAHEPSRLVFAQELAALRHSLSLDVVYVLEEPGEWQCAERGHLTPDALARHLPRQFRRYHVFVCGPPAMMDDVEAALQSLGVPARAIDSERYNVA